MTASQVLEMEARYLERYLKKKAEDDEKFFLPIIEHMLRLIKENEETKETNRTS